MRLHIRGKCVNSGETQGQHDEAGMEDPGMETWQEVPNGGSDPTASGVDGT